LKSMMQLGTSESKVHMPHPHESYH
jgi:hypothetical protein